MDKVVLPMPPLGPMTEIMAKSYFISNAEIFI